MAIVRLDNAALRAVISEHLKVMPADGKLHLWGAPGARPKGEMAIEQTPDTFDVFSDVIGCFGVSWLLCRGTTAPGRTYTGRPLNKLGAAHLMPGAWLYKPGLHKGKKALVQAAPVRVQRDQDRDGTAEPGEPIQVGNFAVNIHRGGSAKLPVGSWSAGCQVIVGEDFPAFLALCEQSKQSEFNYYLLESSWLFPKAQ